MIESFTGNKMLRKEKEKCEVSLNDRKERKQNS